MVMILIKIIYLKVYVPAGNYCWRHFEKRSNISTELVRYTETRHCLFIVTALIILMSTELYNYNCNKTHIYNYWKLKHFLMAPGPQVIKVTSFIQKINRWTNEWMIWRMNERINEWNWKCSLYLLSYPYECAWIMIVCTNRALWWHSVLCPASQTEGDLGREKERTLTRTSLINKFIQGSVNVL